MFAMWKKRLERYVELRDAIIEHRAYFSNLVIFAMRAEPNMVNCR